MVRRTSAAFVLVVAGCHERMCPGGPAYPIDEAQCNERFGPVTIDSSVVDVIAIDASAPNAATPTDAANAPDVRARAKAPPASCAAAKCEGVGQCDAWFEGFVWTGRECTHFSTAGCSAGCQFSSTLEECNEAHTHCHSGAPIAPPECPHSIPTDASSCRTGGPAACTYSSAGITKICTCRNDHWACEDLPH